MKDVSHDCLQHEKFEKLARLTGGVEKAVSTIEKDVNVLFDQNRAIVNSIADLKDGLKDDLAILKDSLKDEISLLKSDLKVAKAKFAIIGSLGIIAIKSLIDWGT
jgi:hypothetical protein